MFTLQQFAAIIGCTADLAERWHKPFVSAMTERQITTRPRIAAFLGQVGHESGSLSRTTENLNYSLQRLREVWPSRFPDAKAAAHYAHAPERLANLVYANRMGNGPYESGDGWRYRGRGPLQITGADNYRRAGIALNLPLRDCPELLELPQHGARAAAWFWEDRGCNALADTSSAVEITKRINGRTHGMADRQERTARAFRLLVAG